MPVRNSRLEAQSRTSGLLWRSISSVSRSVTFFWSRCTVSRDVAKHHR
jgi:hypothetical protein